MPQAGSHGLAWHPGAPIRSAQEEAEVQRAVGDRRMTKVPDLDVLSAQLHTAQHASY